MSKASILIVEDSFIVAYHLRATLEGEGYTVLGKCESGEQALDFVKQKRPDLVLMDIMLAGELSGIDTAAQLRQKHNIPIIYITALTDKDTINRAKLTEPYGYLTKPFEDLEIFTVIEMALYKHEIESKLKQSEERYFSTVNSISDCVVSINELYEVSYLNPSAEKTTGWKRSETASPSIFDVVRLQNATSLQLVNPLQCSLSMQGINQLPPDLQLITRTGDLIPIGESSLSEMRDKKGNTTGLILVFKDMTDKRAHERLMQEVKQHEMAASIAGQENERARIAKDLHDGLGQMLNAIKIKLNLALEDTKNAGELGDLLDEAIQESVRISENLLPAKLKDFDLPTCLKSFCQGFSNTTNTDISFHHFGENFMLGQVEKVNFYRIAQEAVNNALKHSHASHIELELTEEDSVVRLCVVDDGKGCDGVDANEDFVPRHGLVNMRDRAESMGGRFCIEKLVKKGTRITVEVPTAKLLTHGKGESFYSR